MRSTIAFILLLFASSGAAAQQHTFFKSPKGERYTPTQMDSLLVAMQEKTKKLNLRWSTEVTRTYRVGDTLLKEYTLKGINMKSALTEAGLVGSKLPYFDLKDNYGKTINSEQFQGKPLVLNLWYTTCVPCVLEMPDLNTLKKEHALSGVSFLSMTFDDPQTVNAFLKKHRFDFPVATGAKAYLDKMTTAYPMTLFIDKTGVIKYVVNGASITMGEKQSNSEDNLRRFREGVKAISL